MSARNSSWMVSKIIEDQGQDIKIYTKSETVDDDGNVVSESYSNTIETKAWVMPRFASIHEEYDLYGFKNEGDYTMSIGSTIPIRINDKVVLNDGEVLEVREIVKHFEYNSIAYKEVLLRIEGSNY